MRIIRLAVWSDTRKSAVVSRCGIGSRLSGGFGRGNPTASEATGIHSGAFSGKGGIASKLPRTCGAWRRGRLGGVVAADCPSIGCAGAGFGDGNLGIRRCPSQTPNISSRHAKKTNPWKARIRNCGCGRSHRADSILFIAKGMKRAFIHYLVRPGKLIALDETLTVIAEVQGSCSRSAISRLARDLELAGHQIDLEHSTVSDPGPPTAFPE
jgi:hypothetical protein